MTRIFCKQLLVFISAIALMLTLSTVSADDGDRKILLSGQGLNGLEHQRLSIKELESHFQLYQTKIYNPWEKQSAVYRGIWLNDLVVKLASADVTEINFKAIDDYQISISKQEWQDFRILLVTQENGHYIPVANKGPLRIIYPDYDADKKEYEMNLYKWMWMINKIEFQ